MYFCTLQLCLCVDLFCTLLQCIAQTNRKNVLMPSFLREKLLWQFCLGLRPEFLQKGLYDFIAIMFCFFACEKIESDFSLLLYCTCYFLCKRKHYCTYFIIIRNGNFLKWHARCIPNHNSWIYWIIYDVREIKIHILKYFNKWKRYILSWIEFILFIFSSRS